MSRTSATRDSSEDSCITNSAPFSEDSFSCFPLPMANKTAIINMLSDIFPNCLQSRSPSSGAIGSSFSEKHFGLDMTSNRFEWTKKVEPVPPAILDMLAQSGAQAKNSPPSTCSIRTITRNHSTTAGGELDIALSETFIENDFFDRPLYFMAFGVACEVVVQPSQLTSKIPKNCLKIPLPLDKIVRIGSAIAAAPFKYKIQVSDGKSLERPIQSAHLPCWLVLRHFTALDDAKKLAKEAVGGKLSKKQLKRRLRLIVRQSRLTSMKRTLDQDLTKEKAGIVSKSSIGKSAKSQPLPTRLIDAMTAEQKSQNILSQGVEKMPEVETEHVQRVYDSIAPHWHGTRYRTWPRVEEFIANQDAGALIGDFGCGNGKNLPACRMRANGYGIGFDFSTKLLEICRMRGSSISTANANTTSPISHSHSNPRLEVAAADVVNLPIRSGVFDAAISIAVLHHISSLARRYALVRETMCALRIGGSALFYAWALEQGKGNRSGHRFATQDVLVPWHLDSKHRSSKDSESTASIISTCSKIDSCVDGGLQKRARSCRGSSRDSINHNIIDEKATNTIGGKNLTSPPYGKETETHSVTSSFPPRHASFDESKGTLILQRYCHVYKEGELESLFAPLKEWVEITDSYFDCGNWCVIAKRIKRQIASGD